MNPLNLHIGKNIQVNNLNFEVLEIVERKVSENQKEKVFFSYHLKAKNKKITHAEIDFFNNFEIFFHLTKKVESESNEKHVIIDSINYDILSREDGIFMDPSTKEIKNVEIFKLKNNFEGISPHELHITEEFEIFYLNIKIKIGDIKSE